MKYQSELIKEIIDSRGHEKSSLHYESECVECWIEEIKDAYPKLCDYQSEWLNYIKENSGIGEFPYLALLDVTDAVVENVVPYDYKSAILTGNTFVNMLTTKIVGDYSNENIILSDIQTSLLQPNKEYTIRLIGQKSSGYYGFNIQVEFVDMTTELLFNGSIEHEDLEYYDIDFTYTQNKEVKQINMWYHYSNPSNASLVLSDILLFESSLKDACPNYYVNGMQSVKMPVLKTTGKNLFDGELEIGTVNADTGELSDYNPRSRTANFLNIKPNTSYSLKLFNDVYLFNRVFFYDSQKNYISNIVIDKCEKIVTSPENARYIKLVFRKQVASIMEDNDLINISNIAQLEQGTQATPYEPFKSNILTVNEDVTLRSNGNICDELNLLTGQLTQRIDEDGEVLSQEVVKTVGLTVIDQDGNVLSKIKPIEGTMIISTDGTPIKPLLTAEIPVEATTQNLSSFIGLEME